MEASSANDRQHGGSHYKGTPYEHWDWVNDTRQSYLGGNASKYAFRWERKGIPEEDLEKAIHYVDKCAEVGVQGSPRGDRMTFFWGFVTENNIGPHDAMTLYHIQEGNWATARQCLEQTLQELRRPS